MATKILSFYHKIFFTLVLFMLNFCLKKNFFFIQFCPNNNKVLLLLTLNSAIIVCHSVFDKKAKTYFTIIIIGKVKHGFF